MKKFISCVAIGSILSMPLSAPLFSCGSILNEVHILNLCDIHGEIPGYGDDFFDEQPTYPGAIRTSQEIQRIVQQHPGSIVLSGGDNNSSGTFSTCKQGDTMYPVLKAMDVRYSAVGNHAWEWGKEKLENKHFDQLGRTDQTKGNYFITSNILEDEQYREKTWAYHETDPGFETDYAIWKTNKIAWADPYKILDMNGHIVCLIGLTTIKTLEDGNQEQIKNNSFIPYIPAIWYTKHFLKEVEGEDTYNAIDAFVLLTHIGWGEDEATGIAKNVDTKIDLILGAHTHSDYVEYVQNDYLNKKIPFVESQAHMSSFSDAALYFDDTKPRGQKLDHIDIQTISPTIDCGGFDPYSDDPEEKANAKASAAEEILNISNNPINQVVSETILEYDKQKMIAEEKLNEKLGKSINGLAYTQLGKQFEQPYVYCDTLIEQAGAFLCKSEIKGFNSIYMPQAGNVLKPACVAYCTNDSINVSLSAGDVKWKDVYGFFPYDNYPSYCCLTYYQMEQVIEYILSGADRDGLSGEKYYYTKSLYYKEGDTEPIPVDEIRFPYGPNQIYGVSFQVNECEPSDANYGSIYHYVDDSLKIYDPKKSGSDIDDPDTYGNKDYWNSTENGQKYIRVVMSNFNLNGGNKQQKMFKAFSEYNDQNSEEEWVTTQIKTDMDLRLLMVQYLNDIKITGTVDLSNETLKKMFIINQE